MSARLLFFFLAFGALCACGEADTECALGDRKCTDDRTLSVCSRDAEWFVYENCGEGFRCGKNAAKEPACVAGEAKTPFEADRKICAVSESRCLDRATMIQCEKDETKWKHKDTCLYELKECDETKGALYYNAVCADLPCTAGEIRCLPPHGLKKCGRDGTWSDGDPCEGFCTESFSGDNFTGACP